MNDLPDFCFLCLEKHENLANIFAKDTDGVLLQDQLTFFLPEQSGIPKYVCENCLQNVNHVFQFKQKCLDCIITINDCVQTLTARRDSFDGFSIKFADIMSYKSAKLLQEKHIESLKHKNEDSEEETEACSGEKDQEMSSINGFICNICHKIFLNKLKLEIHSRLHSGLRLYECQTCQKTFTRAISFYKHKLTHSKNKSYRCEVCNKTFSTRYYLLHHKKVHINDRPFQCCLCAKTFAYKHIFKVHMDTHLTDKRFRCKFCKYKCAHKYDLIKHFRMHSSESSTNEFDS